jgi:protoporphyrin/coproporphyrin ferrochelatase
MVPASPRRVAVVLFNLGGPDRPEAVRPFLFNLFNDPAIIGAPGFIRTLLANFIAWRRSGPASKIYAHLGGGSPLLPNTQAQAAALEADLAQEGREVRCFIAMRYWHPMSFETAMAVKGFNPDMVVLMPLYPQYSRTTTGSSVKAWHEATKAVGLAVPTRMTLCYPDDDGFIDAQVDLVRAAYDQACAFGKPRLLLSAHGLPKKVIAGGDPYQQQCEQTAQALVDKLGIDGLDWLNCYQSRVGPLEWIGPSTDAELRRAAADKVPVVIAPIAFVSEHSETLVEIEIEYRHMAKELGVPAFFRVPAVGTHPAFIAGLARRVEKLINNPDSRAPAAELPTCSGKKGACSSCG